MEVCFCMPRTSLIEALNQVKSQKKNSRGYPEYEVRIDFENNIREVLFLCGICKTYSAIIHKSGALCKKCASKH